MSLEEVNDVSADTAIPEVAPIAPVVEKPEEPKQVSTREALTEALKTAKEKDEKKPEVDKQPKAAPDKSTAPVEAPVAVKAAKTAPHTWSAPAKAKFATLDPIIQNEILKREGDMDKKINDVDHDRSFGKEMKEAFTPYMAIIQAEGGTPAKAVKELLNTAYVLRTGSPQQKFNVLMQAAKEYGVNLGQQQASPQQQSAIPPEFIQRISQVEGTLKQQKEERERQAQSVVQSQIDAFSSDPSHPHFAQLERHMTALITGGVAKDLQDAYEQAELAHPELRQAALDKHASKLAAQKQAQVAAARKAGSSVSGGPGKIAGAPPKQNLSTRDAIREALAEARANQ